MEGATAYNVGALALAPHAGVDYPGRLALLDKAMQNRVARITIRDWRRGRRHPPQWAIDLLKDAIKERMAALAHALALLEAEKGR